MQIIQREESEALILLNTELFLFKYAAIEARANPNFYKYWKF